MAREKSTGCGGFRQREQPRDELFAWPEISPDEKPRTILYAELSGITIKQSPPANKPIHFGEELHSFNFPITLRVS